MEQVQNLEIVRTKFTSSLEKIQTLLTHDFCYDFVVTSYENMAKMYEHILDTYLVPQHYISFEEHMKNLCGFDLSHADILPAKEVYVDYVNKWNFVFESAFNKLASLVHRTYKMSFVSHGKEYESENHVVLLDNGNCTDSFTLPVMSMLKHSPTRILLTCDDTHTPTSGSIQVTNLSNHENIYIITDSLHIIEPMSSVICLKNTDITFISRYTTTPYLKLENRKIK